VEIVVELVPKLKDAFGKPVETAARLIGPELDQLDEQALLLRRKYHWPADAHGLERVHYRPRRIKVADLLQERGPRCPRKFGVSATKAYEDTLDVTF
jgi:hypothetical protein